MKETLQNGWQKMCKLQKTISQKITTKRATIVAMVVLFLAIVPIVQCGRYAFPMVDDFGYGSAARQAFAQTDSVFATLRAAAATARSQFLVWQGSYSACFLMALHPDVWGNGGYAFVTPFLIATLLIGCYTFCIAFFKRLLKTSIWEPLLTSTILAFVCIQLVPQAQQSFFWYNGAVYYLSFFAFSLVQYALLIVYCTLQKSPKRAVVFVANLLLTVFIGGGNYITAAASSLVCLVFLLCCWRKEKAVRWGVLLTSVVQIVSLLVSVSAPGNAYRQERITGMPFFKSIRHCFYDLFTSCDDWIGVPFFLWMALLLPLFWKIVSNPNLTFSFGFPAFVSGTSALLFAACMFPRMYAMGSVGATRLYSPRLYNMFFFMFVFLFAGNLLYWMGWAHKKLESASGDKNVLQRIGMFSQTHTAALAATVFVCSAIFCLAAKQDITSMEAFREISTGEAQTYAQQRKEWLVLLESDQQDVALPPITVEPCFLAWDPSAQMQFEPDNWVNSGVARYYGKQTVRRQDAAGE